MFEMKCDILAAVHVVNLAFSVIDMIINIIQNRFSPCREFALKNPVYLLLVFLPHAQGEHRMEVWAGDGQQGSVSRDPLVISHQYHITELAVPPLLVETLQHLRSLIHPAKDLRHNTTTC